MFLAVHIVVEGLWLRKVKKRGKVGSCLIKDVRVIVVPGRSIIECCLLKTTGRLQEGNRQMREILQMKQGFHSRGVINQLRMKGMGLEKKLAYIDLGLLCLA